MSDTPDSFSAQRLFDAHLALSREETRLWNFLESLLGCDELPASNVTYDHYDRSFELTRVADDFRWPLDRLQPLWDAGFDRLWLNHRDGSETHYAKSTASTAWRKPAGGRHLAPVVEDGTTAGLGEDVTTCG